MCCRLANSAYFGIPTQVGSVRQAVMLLGLKRLTQMVVAACASTLMDRAGAGLRPAGGRALAALARGLRGGGGVGGTNSSSVRGRRSSPPPSCTTSARSSWASSCRRATTGQARPDQGLSFTAAESDVLGTTHAEIGADVLAKWALPEAMIRTVRWHHAPDEAGPPDTMLDVVHVANMLCLMIGIGVGRDGLHHLPSPVVTRRLGLTYRAPGDGSPATPCSGCASWPRCMDTGP
jgi:hypothetical protein